MNRKAFIDPCFYILLTSFVLGFSLVAFFIGQRRLSLKEASSLQKELQQKHDQVREHSWEMKLGSPIPDTKARQEKVRFRFK